MGRAFGVASDVFFPSTPVVTLPHAENPVETTLTTVADGVSHVEVTTLFQNIDEEELDDLIGDWS